MFDFSLSTQTKSSAFWTLRLVKMLDISVSVQQNSSSIIVIAGGEDLPSSCKYTFKKKNMGGKLKKKFCVY